MKFKQIGYVNIGMGLSMALITSSYCLFTNEKALLAQSILGTGIALIQFALGIKLIRTKEKKALPIKVITFQKDQVKKELDKSELSKDEATIIFKLEKKKELLQSELMEALAYNKVKMSRVLKKLEEKDLIEKKKKGMQNLIVLK